MSLCSCTQGKEASRRQRERFQIPLHHPALERWGLKFFEKEHMQTVAKRDVRFTTLWSAYQGKLQQKHSGGLFFPIRIFLPPRKLPPSSAQVCPSPRREGRRACTFCPGGVRHKFKVEGAGPALQLDSDNLAWGPSVSAHN